MLARVPTSGRARLPAIMTASSNTAPPSVRTCLSALTRFWLPR
ncbi:UNVERIFIED_CONTAM: hypothetical protein GTU68_042403 [Idotea baltica]|nr:hypothetical protein [Idotea baltica]